MMLSLFPPQATRRTSTRRGLVLAARAALLAVIMTLVAAPVASGSVVALDLVEETGNVAWDMDGPTALAVDHRGCLYIVDSGRHRVLVIEPDGSVVRELGGYGWDEDSLDHPLDVVVDRGLATYVLDSGNRRVVEYDADGDYLGVVLEEDQIGNPKGLELGSGGELYVTDADAQIVRVHSQFGEPLDPIGSFGGEEGGLVGPTRVAMGPSREIAVADPASAAVWLYDEFGSPLARLSRGEGFTPHDIIFGPRGHLIVADGRNGTVSVFDRADGSVTASVDRDVMGPSALPSGLAIDRMGRLLVLDGTSGRVFTFALEHDAED